MERDITGVQCTHAGAHDEVWLDTRRLERLDESDLHDTEVAPAPEDESELRVWHMLLLWCLATIFARLQDPVL
jgi:hypothetical protein